MSKLSEANEAVDRFATEMEEAAIVLAGTGVVEDDEPTDEQSQAMYELVQAGLRFGIAVIYRDSLT